MSVLITGGAGFIGSHVASRLLDQGERVIIADNFNDFYDPAIKRKNVRDLQAHGAVDVREIDILDMEGLRGVFADAEAAGRHPPRGLGRRPAVAGAARPLFKRECDGDGSPPGAGQGVPGPVFHIRIFLVGVWRKPAGAVYGGRSG